MKVMMLAAGEGTRLRPHTLKLPKPAIPFLGVPLAYHSLGLFKKLHELELVVNTYHLPDRIEEVYQRIQSKVKSLHFSHEREQILGSGGGLVAAKKHLQDAENFFLINADEVLLTENQHLMEEAYAFHVKNKALSTLLVIEHPEVGSKFGGVWCSGSQVKGFGKAPVEPNLKGMHFVGIQILNRRIFDYLPETGESNILYDGVTAGIKNGEFVQVFPAQSEWFETGNPQDFLAASRKCLQYLSKNSQHADSLASTLKTFLDEPYLLIGEEGKKSLVLESSLLSCKNAKTLESSVIGKNVRIERDTVIRNSMIANDQIVLAGESVLETLLL